MVDRMLFALGTVFVIPLAATSCDTFSGTSGGSPPGDGGGIITDGSAVSDGQATDGEPDGAGPSTCAADLASDPKNCGYCGHDCLGATCAESECAPTELTAIVGDRVLGLAINATNVVWYTANANIATCPLAGCSLSGPTLLFTGADITSIASDDDTVYALDGAGGLVSCSIGGCGSTPIVLASTVGYTGNNALVVDATNVFWDETSSGVYRCAKAGACTPQLISGAGSGGGFLDEYQSQLYWAEMSDAIVTCDSTSCASVRTIGGSGLITSLGVGPGGVFWTDGLDNGSITELPFAGGQPVPIVTGEYRPSGAVTDAAAVYWFTSAGAGSVLKRVPIAGGSAVTVASNQDTPVQLQLDPQYLYWANSTSLWRVAK